MAARPAADHNRARRGAGSRAVARRRQSDIRQAEAGARRAAAGYRIEMQGAVEESAKSQASINAKMPVMLLGIVLLLMVQLQHFGKTVMVLATGPLGLIGAAAALLVFQAPFGFVAILGVIALAGMIMRNSVILVDQIQQEWRPGTMPGDRRVGRAPLPPIVLTAAAAVLALIPLVGEVFWAPMALAMMGGLIAATILTLTFLPALYALVFKVAAPTRPDTQSARESDAEATTRRALQAAA